jgi:hypothetical protein
MNHKAAAQILASKLEALFEPGDETHNSLLLKNPRLLILETMNEAWEEHLEDKAFRILPSHEDWRQVLVELADLVDANLWSQCYLNSPYWIMPRYNVAPILHRIEELKKEWEGKEETPFAPKAKMAAENQLWNEALALQKAAKLMENGMGVTAYKLYLKGQTPALSDTSNLSLLNSTFCDKYIVHPPFTAQDLVYFETLPLRTHTLEGKGIRVDGYAYEFVSKSGDYETTLRMLVIREFMRDMFKALEGRCSLIPRWGSVTVLKH